MKIFLITTRFSNIAGTVDEFEAIKNRWIFEYGFVLNDYNIEYKYSSKKVWVVIEINTLEELCLFIDRFEQEYPVFFDGKNLKIKDNM